LPLGAGQSPDDADGRFMRRLPDIASHVVEPVLARLDN
jgi:hypothetical protein